MATIEESIQRQLRRATTGGFSTRAEDHGAAHDGASSSWQLDRETIVRAAHAGDHSQIVQLLEQVQQTQLAEDFQSRLDEPWYQPQDRLVLDRGERLIGHVQSTKLVGWFHGQRVPIARLQDFAALPELRAQEFEAPLLKIAEEVATNEGAILAIVRSERPEWFELQGWSRCRGQGHTRANTRAILSHLDAQHALRPPQSANFEVRTWRHFELDSILNLYQQLSNNMWGALQRSLENWQWLVGRKAHDQILIAVDTQDRPADASDSDLQNLPAALGYAIVRDSCIVEMLTLPGQAAVSTALLVQACRDAIDRDHHFVSLHTPAADPLHELLVTAGGSWIADSAATGGEWMLKLLAPDRWIERLYPLLHERARDAGIARPLEIDFALDGQPGGQLWRFTLTRRSARWEPIDHSAAAVQCSGRTLQNLLTSNLTFPEAIAQGQLRTPHLSLLRTLSALFPPKLYWQSPFPQLRL